MKKSLFFVFFLVIFQQFIFANSSGVVCDKSNKVEIKKASMRCMKNYIDMRDICLAEKAIYVHFNDEWIQVSSLNSDDQGIYVDNVWPLVPFSCQNCCAWNESWRVYCKICGLRRPD